MTDLNALKLEILGRSNARKQATIESLWKVLERMRSSAHVDFSIASVGRICEKHGFLRTQSIRNAAGQDYRTLIEAFHSHSAGGNPPQLKGARRSEDPLKRFVDSLSDLDMKTRLGILLSEHTKQREEINRLRHGFKALQAPAASVETLIDTPKQVAGAILTPLRRFLGKDWAEERGWTLDANGALYDASGERVTPIGFDAALRKVLAAVSSSES